ncbi:hypothetical protein CALVIDRAFT_527224 [Calocera viscosa TUFC12733]|uniref:Uncharacterized protein n=1 Tax=Calocera viscosa (strain TUFC12733) TaxID=1330018 RepID=A0A167MPZ1_CALVF|nr:hypothetical protein CALVIDRAFT_527224 [Calocera viscosa TUFC12733]
MPSTTPRGSKRPLDEPSDTPTSPTRRRADPVPVQQGTLGTGTGTGGGQVAEGQAGGMSMRGTAGSPGISLQQLQRQQFLMPVPGLVPPQAQAQPGQGIPRELWQAWSTLPPAGQQPQGFPLPPGLTLPGPAGQQLQGQQGSPVAFGSLGLKNVPSFGLQQLGAFAQHQQQQLQQAQAQQQQQAMQQQQQQQLAPSQITQQRSPQPADSLLMPPPSLPARSSPTGPSPTSGPGQGQGLYASYLTSPWLTPGTTPDFYRLLQSQAQAQAQQQQQPATQPTQQQHQPTPSPRSALHSPATLQSSVQPSPSPSRGAASLSQSVDPSPRARQGALLPGSNQSQSQVSSSSAGEGEERGSEDELPGPAGPGARPKRGEGSVWKPEETEDLFNWVFSSPQHILEADQRPSRFFITTPSSIGAPRPRHGIANRWKRLLETQRRLNAYDFWARARNLEPYVDNKFRVAKQMERAREEGVKLGQLTPFTAMIWYSRGWLERFNQLNGSIPPDRNELPPAGTLTPASSSGRALAEEQGSEEEDGDEEEASEINAPTITSPLRRGQGLHPQASPRSNLQSPSRRSLASVPQPSASGVHLNSPQSSSSRTLEEPPTDSPGDRKKSDKMDRAINVALQLVTQDNQNIDPALRKKATDLLNSVLDQASDDLR